MYIPEDLSLESQFYYIDYGYAVLISVPHSFEYYNIIAQFEVGGIEKFPSFFLGLY